MIHYPKSLILVGGAGKMGNAIYQALLNTGMPKKAIIINDVHGENAKRLEEIDIIPECILLAIKPQQMDELLSKLAQKFGSTPLYISIAAGKSIDYLRKHLGHATIIRAMPNISALIGEAVTALYADSVSKEHKEMATAILKAAGEVVWIDDEKLMDVVTAISGSGPAYAFLFLQGLIEAGIAQGLPDAIARQIAIQTLLGSSKLTKLSPELLVDLRADVTSKGGTTEAALAVLMKDDKFKTLIAGAVAAAVKRAKELA